MLISTFFENEISILPAVNSVSKECLARISSSSSKIQIHVPKPLMERYGLGPKSEYSISEL